MNDDAAPTPPASVAGPHRTGAEDAEPGASGPAERLHLADPEQAKDLATLISRARTVDQEAAVRLQARGTVLAVWVPVMSAETLLEQVPTVVGMRAAHLARPARVDATVPGAAVLDRLARGQRPGAGSGPELVVPSVTARAAWSGALPGGAGWEPLGQVSASRLRELAEQGSRAVEQALPSQAGAAVLSTVRARIWGSPQEPGGYVTGAAFGAEVLGFLAGGDFRLTGLGPWRRLSNRAGHLLARPGTTL